MRIVFICYPRCATCRKAKKWLDDRRISYKMRDIQAENPTLQELKQWWEKSGLPLKKLFNSSGLKYKEMQLSQRLPEMSDEEKLELLASEGMLVKRPVFVGEDRVLFGFRESEWEQMLPQ